MNTKTNLYSNTAISTERVFIRPQAAEYLTSRGFPITRATLESLVTRGGGPRYGKFGGRVIYRKEDLDDWADASFGCIASTAAEHRTAGNAQSLRKAAPTNPGGSARPPGDRQGDLVELIDARSAETVPSVEATSVRPTRTRTPIITPLPSQKRA